MITFATSLLSNIWRWLIDTMGPSIVGHPLFFAMVIITTVVVAGFLFSVADVITGKLPLRPSLKYAAITLPGYLAVFGLIYFVPLEPTVPPTNAPTAFAFARDFIVCMIVGDILSYWWHRLEHGNRWVFRRVHYVHHKVKRPLTVWSGFYVHPVESLCVFSTFYVYPLIAGVHPMTFAAYAMVNTFITMVTHCGYKLPLYPEALFASASMHDQHHGRGKVVNFCVLLTLSDRLFGTYRAAPKSTTA